MYDVCVACVLSLSLSDHSFTSIYLLFFSLVGFFPFGLLCARARFFVLAFEAWKGVPGAKRGPCGGDEGENAKRKKVKQPHPNGKGAVRIKGIRGVVQWEGMRATRGSKVLHLLLHTAAARSHFQLTREKERERERWRGALIKGQSKEREEVEHHVRGYEVGCVCRTRDSVFLGLEKGLPSKRD